jgi:uncharacterized protein YjhX (UPF0386 family)
MMLHRALDTTRSGVDEHTIMSIRILRRAGYFFNKCECLLFKKVQNARTISSYQHTQRSSPTDGEQMV